MPRRFQRRKSSTKPPVCIHCQYVEEQRKRSGSAGFYFDAQEFRALTYSDSSSSSSSESEEDKEDDDDEIDYFLQPNNALLPPSPCSIVFTLSPTICDYPAFPMPSVVPGSPPPPALPSSPPLFPSSPTIEFPCDLEEVPGNRSRRKSISRQEAIFVEPTGNSLENVSNSEKDQLTNHDDTTIIKAIIKQDDPFVRDIFLTVPDLKRDRAASVDSCFTKVPSAKTEEVQPIDGELNLLSVPNSGAVRSRSVDIVLPTEQQARYKALALAGPANNMYSKG